MPVTLIQEHNIQVPALYITVKLSITQHHIVKNSSSNVH